MREKITVFLATNLEKYVIKSDIGNENESFVIIRDFYCEIHEESSFVKFMFLNSFTWPYMLQNPENPTCIDLILTKKPICFQNSTTIETRLSDFQKMTTTILKTFFRKQNLKLTLYRKYKNYDNPLF